MLHTPHLFDVKKPWAILFVLDVVVAVLSSVVCLATGLVAFWFNRRVAIWLILLLFGWAAIWLWTT
ncbi:MAG: hypothetical protein JW976_11720 [Syntrophaceae bacterium]|nr:hypothetical protein [Syntrophaceae bacterium]